MMLSTLPFDDLLKQLTEILTQGDVTRDFNATLARVREWKGHAVKALTAQVSASAAQQWTQSGSFARISDGDFETLKEEADRHKRMLSMILAVDVGSSSPVQGGVDQYVSCIHLSDLHFDGTENTQLLAEQLFQDVDDQNLPNLRHLVVSGDFADMCSPQGYKAAVELIRSTMQHYRIPVKRTMLVPGNHDVDYEASRRAYMLAHSRKYDKNDERMIDAGEAGVLIRDDVLYKKRFERFSNELFEPIMKTPYPPELDRQFRVIADRECGLLFLGLNSATSIDHRFQFRAGIHDGALAGALNSVRKYNDPVRPFIKIVVWHHPVHGPRAMNDGFIDLVVRSGFSIGLHGDIHETVKDYREFDEATGGLRIIGAGTFAPMSKQLPPGTPREYNTITFDLLRRTARVNARSRVKAQGSWGAFAIFGDRVKEPKAWYEVPV